MTEPSEPTFAERSFAAAFHRFLNAYDRLLPPKEIPVREAVVDHLGMDPDGLPSVSEQLHPADHPNLQLAIDHLADDSWKLLGLPGELRHYGGFSLVGILAGRVHGMVARPTAVEYVNVAVAYEETYPCVTLGLYLGRLDGEPVAALLASSMEHGPRSGLSLEVLARDPALARAFIARVRAAMHEHDVYRGKLLGFSQSQWGSFSLTFHHLPELTRDDVILPAADLDAIELHSIGIAERADALRAAGRHLKRGLLLYGPPGTGKTLSVMYLANRMAGRTTLLLTGAGTMLLGQAMALARALQPSMVVVEDVDLVAMERMMPGRATNPFLFELLNEMDGLAADADVLFVLTTNRVELLEPALAARPGRIDQAVEIKLPDADARRRLFDLYLRGVDHQLARLDTFVAATEGVSAAFVKELVRRAVVDATPAGAARPSPITDEHVERSLTDLLVHSAPLTRAILGASSPD